MFIQDKKIMGLSLVRNEFNKYVGCYNQENNTIRKFHKEANNLYELIENFGAYFPNWQDQGFGIYSYNKLNDITTLLIKDKIMHENNANRIIKENSKKMYPELREEFIKYCKNRLSKINYMHVQINKNYKDYHYSVDENGNFLRICDVKGFLLKYPYFPDLSYVPKFFYRELQLVEKSIERRHDVGLDFCLKLATDMSENDILDFQDKFREDKECFVFDKTDKEHLQYLIKYLKDKTPENKHFNVINLLYSIHGYEYKEMELNPNSYCIKYTHGMKKELINLIIEDEDCVSVINTNIIPKKDRNKMIKENDELIKELRYIYHDDVDIEYMKNYIDKDINNLKYINVSSLMRKDIRYTCNILNEYICNNLECSKESIVDKILLKYDMCIKETTIKKCIEGFPLDKLHFLTKIKENSKFIPHIINRLNGENIKNTDQNSKKSLRKIADMLGHDYKMNFIEKDNDLIISFVDSETGGIIKKMYEPVLSDNVVGLNRSEVLNVYWEDNLFGNWNNVEKNTEYSKQLGVLFG